MLGGEDEDSDDPDGRERLGPEKTQALLGKLQALLPRAEPTLGFAWSGAFGQTSDGLPLIGRVPGQPRMLAAYGYGGNGITFSFLASRVHRRADRRRGSALVPAFRHRPARSDKALSFGIAPLQSRICRRKGATSTRRQRHL